MSKKKLEQMIWVAAFANELSNDINLQVSEGKYFLPYEEVYASNADMAVELFRKLVKNEYAPDHCPTTEGWLDDD